MNIKFIFVVEIFWFFLYRISVFVTELFDFPTDWELAEYRSIYLLLC